jgi:hypothetical protein
MVDEVGPIRSDEGPQPRQRRLRKVTATELRFRGGERLRAGFEALQFISGSAAWRPERLGSALLPRSPQLIEARTALGNRDLPRAHAALRTHFLQRPSRFLIDPSRQALFADVLQSRFPAAADDARRRGSAVIQGRYNLLGYEDVAWPRGADIDWHFDPVNNRRAPGGFWTRVPFLDPGSGDHKVIWELNRHQHWLTLGRTAYLTGDVRYAAAFKRQLDSWLRANPPLTGANWASMLELAFRSISWIWALHLFLPSEDDPGETWLVGLLLGLDRQLEHISRHLSLYFSPNTHLLGEGLALYVAGRVLPELRRASRWEAAGRQVLVEQAHAQVNDDGGHVELSPHYHRYALDFYLLALAIARRSGDPVGESFAEVASQMASFCRTVADDNGQLPTIGDDDGGMLFPIGGRRPSDARDSLALAARLLDRPDLAVGDPPEEVFWMTGGDVPRTFGQRRGQPGSTLLKASGYAVLRTRSQHAIVDVGRFGFLNGGHAHADALSMVLSVRGHRLLIDPGTATYTMDRELRDRFRSSAMHNTVVVDGRSQAQPAGPFHWHSRASASATKWASGPRYDCIDGQHDGYLPHRHRRTVLRTDDLWLVADHLVGTGDHRLDAHWHVDPAWTPAGEHANGVRLYHPDGLWAAFASTAAEVMQFHGDPGGLGWCAPVYGQLVPSLTLRCSRAGATPLTLISAIAAAERQIDLSIEAATAIGGDDGWHRSAVVGTCQRASLLAVFATQASADGESLSSGLGPGRCVQRIAAAGGEFATDARVAVLWLSEAGEPTSLLLIEGTTASWSGSGAFYVPPTSSAADLHLDGVDLARLSLTFERFNSVSADRTLCAE